jgi:hypothetical protein
MDPFHLLLACYEVLHAAHDPRAAAVLAVARTELTARAAAFSDPDLQRSFLEQIPTHHKLLHMGPEA